MYSVDYASEPSMGDGTRSVHSATSRHKEIIKAKILPTKGAFFWRGNISTATFFIMMLPWRRWWQTVVLLFTIFGYVVQFLLSFLVISNSTSLLVLLLLSDIVFFCDVVIHILHNYWSIARLYLRVYKRNQFMLFYDCVSLIPLYAILDPKISPVAETMVLISRLVIAGRIYRWFLYYANINETMHHSRRMLCLVEHSLTLWLFTHAATCIWYWLKIDPPLAKPWYNLTYPSHIYRGGLKFNNYLHCFYYCNSRVLNVIFGDSYPFQSNEEIITSLLMLVGYVMFRYNFIGILAWHLVAKNARRFNFIDQYHHMVRYLKFRSAPESLITQAMNYKKELWTMKDGILMSNHLQQLPVPMQMELIFDINVGHFHDSVVFRDLEESYMRQTSLLMRHELYLAGQRIWNQGVVKNGMICIKRGVLEMLSDEDDESPVIAFKTGTVLGELSLYYSIPSKVTVKAATYVELQVLRRTDFMRAMADEGHVLRDIRAKIENRIQNARQRQNAIVEYDKGDSRLIRAQYRPMKLLKDYLAGVEQEDPTFVDDSHMFYRDENNERRPKFTTQYLELYKLAGNVTTIQTPKICIRSTFPWILEPNTAFTHMCDVAHFLMILYISIMAPYYAILNTDRTDVERVISTIVIAGLLLHNYIQLTTAIVKKNVRKETLREIAEEKMTTFGFYLDVVSIFPIYIFTDTVDRRGETAAGQVALLFPVLQIWHLPEYLNKWSENFNSNVKTLKLIKYTLLLNISCYWSGCFLYLYACPRGLCREETWMESLIYRETKMFIVSNALHERPAVTALFFGTSVFTGNGMSELSPDVSDVIVVVLLCVLGFYLSCFYTAHICSIYLLSTSRKLKFRESMRELFFFLSVNNVSHKIKARVKKFFTVQWYYNNAVSARELFADMSANIQQEVLSIDTVESLLHCPLFHDCSRDFQQTVATNIRTIALPDDEIVQHAGDIGRDMYILQKGHCDVLNHNGKVVSVVGPGTTFGFIEMLLGLPKVYTVVTTTNCILQHLEYSALVHCLSTFPDISHPIMMAIEDKEVQERAKAFEEARPLTGRLNAKINRFTQEIKDSFVVMSYRSKDYVQEFEKLGILRFFRFVIIPATITPHGIFLKIWCWIRFIMALFYVVIIPYNYATKSFKHGNKEHWADTFLYVDLLVMAYVAYYNERSLLITHPLLTISRYFKRAFFWDIISVFPFEFLFQIVKENAEVDVFRMNRILQITRIMGAFHYWESDIMRVNQLIVLLKFLPIVLTIVNLATAIFFMNSCVTFYNADSLFLEANCSRIIQLNVQHFETVYALPEYLYTFFSSYEVFFGSGCTASSMNFAFDTWLMMALKITGYLYFAFMFGYVASTRSSAANSLLEHNEKTADLANFLYQENVDPALTAKTLRYFEYVWKRTNGSNPQQICRRLNSALMEDTLVFMYERSLREVPLFGKVERSFIRIFTQHLNEMYFLRGETVIQCKDVQSYIFIIYRGKVDVMSHYNEMITCMGPGGMFGNFTGQSISCSDVTIYASRSLDLLVIPSQSFFNLVRYYPKIHEPLKKAFEISKDYILPISMEMGDDSSSDDSYSATDSMTSGDSRSMSSRVDVNSQYTVSLSARSSQSNLSQTKSIMSSNASVMLVYNFFVPGTLGYQTLGYLTCFMATFNYLLILYELTTLNDCNVLYWLHAFFDVYFYIVVYYRVHEAFTNRHGNIVTDPVKCRRAYCKRKMSMWMDILVNIPLESFGLCNTTRPLFLIHYLRLNKIFRLKYMVQFYNKTAAELTNNITTLQAVTTLIIVVILVHSFSCLWLITTTAVSPIAYIHTTKMHVTDEENPKPHYDYATSLYIIVAAVTTTGGDEFDVTNGVPLIISAFSLLCGKLLAAAVVATAMQVAYSSKHALTSYEKATKELMDVLKNQGLSSYQIKKYWAYVKQLWITERGRQLPALLKATPYVRRCDLMSAMFGQHLRNCYIFANSGEPFLRQLSVVLDFNTFFPGNYILMAGNSEARMYWVESGTVSVVSVRSDLTEITHEVLSPGDMFGLMQGLYRGISHCFSYRAETKVGILSLSLDSWIDILPFFPESQNSISSRADIIFTSI